MCIIGRVDKQQGILSISGRFDFIVHREFKKHYTALLGNAEIREIEINMRSVEYIDSAALGMLMLLKERAGAINKSVVLSNPSGNVSNLLEVANFNKIFPIRGLAPQFSTRSRGRLMHSPSS